MIFTREAVHDVLLIFFWANFYFFVIMWRDYLSRCTKISIVTSYDTIV